MDVHRQSGEKKKISKNDNKEIANWEEMSVLVLYNLIKLQMGNVNYKDYRSGGIPMDVRQLLENLTQWQPPVVGEDIPHGDMPGDKVEIGEVHIQKANVIFPKLLEELKKVFVENHTNKAVVAVCGGSGVGKSETASLLSYYFKCMGIGSYTLSGDNYPRRIPMYNDAERLHIFRESGLRAMIEAGTYSEERYSIIKEFQINEDDANKAHITDHPWMASYIDGGVEGLKGYLGTAHEIEFDQMTKIVKSFKAGEEKIWLKRMGRTNTELWYEAVDFSDIQVLVIEWTHGNSDYYEGVDIPVLLNSTPQETLEHRRSRNRDGKIDSPFTMRVLEIEQGMLMNQAHKAKIILSKRGELLSFADYEQLMAAQKIEM